MNNYMRLNFKSISENEALARLSVCAFIQQMNPTLEEIADIKTSISEAVTNAIIHGYEEEDGIVEVCALLEEDILTLKVSDEGKGIEDIPTAREPLYTSKPEMERSGMGFTIMESFMDSIEVLSSKNKGTTVIMQKKLGRNRDYSFSI